MGFVRCNRFRWLCPVVQVRADKDSELKRLDSFLLLASQENSSLRRQLLNAGLVPDVITADPAGAGDGLIPPSPRADNGLNSSLRSGSEQSHLRKGLVVSMLVERSAKNKADADKYGPVGPVYAHTHAYAHTHSHTHTHTQCSTRVSA